MAKELFVELYHLLLSWDIKFEIRKYHSVTLEWEHQKTHLIFSRWCILLLEPAELCTLKPHLQIQHKWSTRVLLRWISAFYFIFNRVDFWQCWPSDWQEVYFSIFTWNYIKIGLFCRNLVVLELNHRNCKSLYVEDGLNKLNLLVKLISVLVKSWLWCLVIIMYGWSKYRVSQGSYGLCMRRKCSMQVKLAHWTRAMHSHKSNKAIICYKCKLKFPLLSLWIIRYTRELWLCIFV